MKNTLNIALAELGQSEEKAPGEHNPRIVEYHAAVSLRATDDETPWCSSFANWVLDQAGISGTDSAAARSFLKWGVECKPTPGCIVVLRRGKSAWMGHVGFLVSDDHSTVTLVGGNQSDSVSVKKFNRADVLGYRTVKTAKKSATVVSAVVAGSAGVAPLVASWLTDFCADPITAVAAALVGVAGAGGVISERLQKISTTGG